MRSGDKDFDKGDLKDELKEAGVEDCVADDIADRVDKRKMDNWNQSMARQEALKELEMLINKTQQAYDNYRERNTSNQGTMPNM
jgi:ribosomal protein L13E